MWFSRRRQSNPVQETWWSSLFSPSQYEDFLRLVRAYFEKRGEHIIIDDQGVLCIVGDAEQKNAGLHNLAQRCHQLKSAQWEEYIEGHFNELDTIKQEIIALKEHLTDFAYIEKLLSVRIYPDGFAPLLEAPHTTVHRKDIDGTNTTLMYDLPSSVSSMERGATAAWGKTDEELFAIGMANVRRNHPPEITSQTVRNKIPVFAFSEDFYATTYALCLNEYPQCIGKYGALVGIPHRSALIAYPVNDASVLDVVHELIGCIQYMYKEGPGSISPLLYWYYQGRYYAFGYQDTGSKLHIAPPQEFLNTVFPDGTGQM